MAKKKDAIEKQGPTDLEVYDYGDDSGAGMDLDASFYAVPFINLLQTNSPMCQGRDASHRPGDFYNTVSEKSIDGEKGFTATLVKVSRCFTRWVPRDKGGGLVGKYDPSDPIVAEAISAAEKFGKNKVDGDDLIETFELCLLLEDEDGNPTDGVLVPITSTKIKPLKRYNSAIGKVQVGPPSNRRQPPIYAHRLRMIAVESENQHGTFFTVEIQPAEKNAEGSPDVYSSLLSPKDPRFAAAKAFYEMLAEGRANIDHNQQAATRGEGEETPF